MRREAIRLKAIREPAATKINNAARRYLARRVRIKKEKARYQEWIANAKRVKEYWSDDYNAWYYYDDESGETFWEPTKTGYTKHDSQLVLASGQVIDDPTLFIEDDMQDALAKPVDSKFCSECSTRVAIRMCLQCGDKFCCPCYKEQHATGSRLKHAWEPLGPRECADCEVELAERFCIPCDEAFCDACWRRVHLKGKRRFHPFSNIDTKGNIQPKILTIDGAEITTAYDPSYSQQQLEQSTAVVSHQPNTTEEWGYAYDDNGYIYWYNNLTGQSQYEDPYSTMK
jgi:hypothetical protein